MISPDVENWLKQLIGLGGTGPAQAGAPTEPQMQQFDPQASFQQPAAPNVGFMDKLKFGLGQYQDRKAAELFPMTGAAEAGMTPEQIYAQQKAAQKQLRWSLLGSLGQGGDAGEMIQRAQGLAQAPIQLAMRQNEQKTAAQRYADETQYARGRDATGDAWRAQEAQRAQGNFDTNQSADAQYRQQQLAMERQRLAIEAQRARQAGLGSVPQGYRLKPDGSMEYIPGGPADPNVTQNNRTLRPVPPAAAQGIVGNNVSLAKIDAALAALDKNPDAFGMQNYLPDALTQRMNGKAYSGGIDPRAKVADIGSLLIHDRSGAAVTAAEFPRLKPFIPQATDDPKTVKTKLENLRANIALMQEETQSMYTPETGYRPLPDAAHTTTPQAAAPAPAAPAAPSGPVPIKSDADYAALPSGAEFIAPDGSHRRKP